MDQCVNHLLNNGDNLFNAILLFFNSISYQLFAIRLR
jgi:hypothetical protein